MLGAGCLTGVVAGIYGQVVINSYLKQVTGYPVASISASWRPLEILALVVVVVLAIGVSPRLVLPLASPRRLPWKMSRTCISATRPARLASPASYPQLMPEAASALGNLRLTASAGAALAVMERPLLADGCAADAWTTT